jgi:membrane dipeptidase
MIPIFDGHNDVLLRLVRKGEEDGGVASFLHGDGAGQLDLPRARAGGLAGGLFAVFIPSPEVEPDRGELMQAAHYDLPLPNGVPLTHAQSTALDMVALLLRIERRSGGAARVCRTGADIRDAVATGALATVLHMEGAEPIDREFRMLEVLYGAGLRSLGPVWSRANIFGHGVPFRFPSSPDTGPGLTDEGKALVMACNELKVVVDLSHLNEQGFWDVAALSDAPLVASHSNAHALCPHSRNLTDRQLAAIRESGGFVGVNFASGLPASGRAHARRYAARTACPPRRPPDRAGRRRWCRLRLRLRRCDHPGGDRGRGRAAEAPRRVSRRRLR